MKMWLIGDVKFDEVAKWLVSLLQFQGWADEAITMLMEQAYQAFVRSLEK